MVKKKSKKTSAVILILALIVLSGCSKNPNSKAVKTDNINQSRTASNNNIPANNNVPDSLPNTSTTTVDNTSAAIVKKDNKSSTPVKEPTPQIGSGANDLFLFSQVRSALSSDQELFNAVIVEIKEGNAVLTGNVSSEAQKTKAEQLIQSVKGFKSVKNNLRVLR